MEELARTLRAVIYQPLQLFSEKSSFFQSQLHNQSAPATETSQQTVAVDTVRQPVTAAPAVNSVSDNRTPSFVTMSNVEQDLGGGDVEEVPVASAEHSASQPAGPSASSGSDEMWKYVCQMATLHPKINHPPCEWIDQHFSDAAPVVWNNSSPEDGVLTLASVKALLEARDARLDERFTQSETAISGFRQRNTLNELSFRGGKIR